MNDVTTAIATAEPGSLEAPVRTLSPDEWVHQHGDYLFRQALIRTDRPELAEDLVQETFLAAWKSAPRFAGRASERTWLLSILRHKIADHYRRHERDFETIDTEELARLEEQQFRQGGLGGGSWQSPVAPRKWTGIEPSLEQAEFWKVLHECTQKLPASTARVFLLREVDEWSTDAICRELQIKPQNLFVMLHRARLALRRCLELNWFRDYPKTARSTQGNLP